MNARAVTLMVALAFGAMSCDGHLPGKPLVEKTPDAQAAFDTVYFTNCQACHGPSGRGGPARPLNDAYYLATIEDTEIEAIIHDGHGLLMPSFNATGYSGLSEHEIDSFVAQLRIAWGKEGETSSAPYVQPSGANAEAGAKAFAANCGACHGDNGKGKPGKAGSVVDQDYLQLVSAQALRSSVLFGRIDLGCPGSKTLGLSSQAINDITAWLLAQQTRARGGANE